jgi:hypothetical protein
MTDFVRSESGFLVPKKNEVVPEEKPSAHLAFIDAVMKRLGFDEIPEYHTIALCTIEAVVAELATMHPSMQFRPNVGKPNWVKFEDAEKTSGISATWNNTYYHDWLMFLAKSPLVQETDTELKALAKDREIYC